MLACPIYNYDTCSLRLTNGKKQCYMGYRRFLPPSHKWRATGRILMVRESRAPPRQIFGADVYEQVRDLEHIIFEKSKKQHESRRQDNWKKRSIFFELPYWENLFIRHNLDVMHIEKNVCDNIMGALLGVQEKTKDNQNSHLDLQAMGIRQELHPIQKDDNTYLLPVARYAMSTIEKITMLQFLRDIKVLDGFSSNTSRCV